MTEIGNPLADLTRRVTEKFAAAWQSADPWPLPEDPLEPASWMGSPVESAKPLPADWPQFPAERWLVYPARRAYCLALADNAIDHGHLAEAGFLIQYGGMERIS